MKCLIRLCDEAGLGVFRGGDTLSMLNTVAWRYKRERSVDREQRKKARNKAEEKDQSSESGIITPNA